MSFSAMPSYSVLSASPLLWSPVTMMKNTECFVSALRSSLSAVILRTGGLEVRVTSKTSERINQSINRSINQSIDRSINQSINQSINRPINQSINWSISRPINQSINGSITSHWKTVQNELRISSDRGSFFLPDCFICKFLDVLPRSFPFISKHVFPVNTGKRRKIKILDCKDTQTDRYLSEGKFRLCLTHNLIAGNPFTWNSDALLVCFVASILPTRSPRPESCWLKVCATCSQIGS